MTPRHMMLERGAHSNWAKNARRFANGKNLDTILLLQSERDTERSTKEPLCLPHTRTHIKEM